MSEDAADIVYLIVVAIGISTTTAKVIAWRRERSGALRLIATCSAVGVGAFLFATPVVYRAVAVTTGSPNLAELLVFFCILGFFAHTHVMAMLWQPERMPPFAVSALAVRLSAYGLLGLLMLAGFLLSATGDTPHPMDFNIAYGQDPGALLMLAAFQSGLAYASLATAIRFRRTALLSAQRDPRLSRALHHISIATWFIAGYVVCVGPATLAGALGSHALDPLHSLGPVSGTIGAFVINYGFSGAAVAAWRADRRDYIALAPLWELTRQADPRMALTEPNRLTALGFFDVRDWHLLTRIADILTVVQSLGPYFDAAPADRIRRVAGAERWTEAEERAAAAAATLLDAIARKNDGADPPAAPAPLPGRGLSPAEERAHLVKVAGRLRHPAVRAAAGVPVRA
ncbi:DUF6545 domain-containing protein [Streptomyces sp. ISL-94]|uniref:DUF6545 domain-containing protein n=1 Tax=Streptomyces sp. ISL-94 TaxID=2819190 RepID=UPI001BEA1DB8|nr:DUF6545 domain-containing protein [Streptomyces sp. ISL-94]MBT2482417.1 hypothetical protein [Streptomyces sp. ISL-94]